MFLQKFETEITIFFSVLIKIVIVQALITHIKNTITSPGI